MKLTIEGLKEKESWKKAGITLPDYDIAQVHTFTNQNPRWVHFGAGNIFRIFIGGIADTLLTRGDMQEGIICVETFDFDVIDKIYAPYDNLVLAVTLNADGTTEKKVLGSLTDAVKAVDTSIPRLKELFAAKSLQMVSFTITEKGYALTDANGKFFPFVQRDIADGPEKASSAMAVLCAMLYHRYQENAQPLAVVSMDNCSHNGEKLQNSVNTIAAEWQKNGFVDAAFISYLNEKVSFPWSMIDKITPRPADSVYESLEHIGVEDMKPIITSKNTYIAPFVNAERPQYLVIEDDFPNGRPPLEKAGVYMTDRRTVNDVERMKVTTCLNPLHTALAVYGCLLGYTRISEEMKDAELSHLVHTIGLVEGMPVVVNPGILSPKDFVKEVLEVRFPNPFMPDAPQRIATDTSQKVGIRFGETMKAYAAKDGDASALTAIPLAIAGWCRYLLAVDDTGMDFELSSDPMLDELTEQLQDIELGKPETYHGQLKPILSNANIFGSNLYDIGVGDQIEKLFIEEIAGKGAVRATLCKYLKTEMKSPITD